MKLAVVHDLAEALAGDIAPFQNVSKEEKRRLEEEGLDKISATIGSDPIGECAAFVDGIDDMAARRLLQNVAPKFACVLCKTMSVDRDVHC